MFRETARSALARQFTQRERVYEQRELRSLARRIAIELLVAVIIGTLLGLLGPFDTYRLAVGLRLAYWIFMIVAGLAIFRPTMIASDWLAAEAGLPGWVAGLLAIAIGSLPMTLLVAWLMTGFDLARALHFPDMPVLFGQVLLISILTNGAYRLVFRNSAAVSRDLPLVAVPEPSTISERPLSRFDERLPLAFGPLLALSSEDHYVRAHAEQSTTLILIRLRDAIAELDPAVEGMQVHRSWWVARAAVASHQRSERALRLVLINGQEVPVSRERIAELKAAGWI